MTLTLHGVWLERPLICIAADLLRGICIAHGVFILVNTVISAPWARIFVGHRRRRLVVKEDKEADKNTSTKWDELYMM